ncbi:MAG: MPMin1 [Rhodococcus erythropolis]|jgi:DNA (cytosine-5)-methyltransferase 1|nr:DNA cytosine methyltransferase [Rhodococcus erythropolis]MDF2895727.1 MPMin1 [Rhodococcus erythropolis]
MITLDLFAGTGWGVACQRLGILEHGVELMPEAVASRDAAGMHTAYHDVWDGLADPAIIPGHDLLIASPPCQTFSVAGKGSGRKALDDVLSLIQTGAWAQKGTALRDAASAFGLDDRTALVLSPLAYVAHSGPMHVVLEQVPAVLPVWEAVAMQMRALGYSVVTGVLSTEQYGVPQTRRRAVLVARRDGIAAALPVPSHSRYYPLQPGRRDRGVLPWVSMSEALGELRPEIAAWRWKGMPATTVAGDPRITAREHHFHGEQSKTSLRLTADEAARLQTYPDGFPFHGTQGKRFLQIGNAVPPLFGQAIITAALAGSVQTTEAVAA